MPGSDDDLPSNGEEDRAVARDGATPPPDSALGDDDDPSTDGGSPSGGYVVRRGSVDVRTCDGERTHHDEAAVRYEADAFVVSADGTFAPATTVSYPKARVAWLEVRHPRQ